MRGIVTDYNGIHLLRIDFMPNKTEVNQPSSDRLGLFERCQAICRRFFNAEHHPVVELFATGWKLAGSWRPLLFVSLAIFACAQAITLMEPYIIGQLINCAQRFSTFDAANRDILIGQIQFYLLLFLATQIGFWLFNGPGRLLERSMAFHIRANYRLEMVKVLTELPLKWQRDHHSGDSIDKINRAGNSLFQAYEGFSELAYIAFRFLGAQAILIYFMPSIGLMVLAITLIALPAIVFGFDKLFARQYKQLNLLENAVASAIHDYLTNIVSVIVLRLKVPVLREIQEKIYASLKLFRTNSMISEGKWFLTALVVAVMIVAVLFLYMQDTLAKGGILLGGTFFILFEYVRRIGASFHSLAWTYGRVFRQAIDLKGASPLLKSYESLAFVTPVASVPSDWASIEVRNLCFVYEDEKHRTHHLNDICLDLKRNSRIALFGESGSGKSTLLSLLRGIEETDQAEVCQDGVRLPHGLRHLAGCTTLLHQDAEIFADTVRFNITFGMAASDAHIERVIKLARFDTVLKNLPDGLETSLAEKGFNLSGGEKQRLALARVLFFAQDSSIILLDEPTSHVDLENERLIYSGLFDAFENRCVVAAIHGLHLINYFDTVYVLKKGTIVEHGNPERVLSMKDRLLT